MSRKINTSALVLLAGLSLLAITAFANVGQSKKHKTHASVIQPAHTQKTASRIDPRISAFAKEIQGVLDQEAARQRDLTKEIGDLKLQMAEKDRAHAQEITAIKQTDARDFAALTGQFQKEAEAHRASDDQNRSLKEQLGAAALAKADAETTAKNAMQIAWEKIFLLFFSLGLAYVGMRYLVRFTKSRGSRSAKSTTASAPSARR